MFATRPHADALSAQAKKRPRDEQDQSAAGSSFGEHRNKRIQQCLALRTSPKSPSNQIQPLASSSITGSAEQPRYCPPWSSAPGVDVQAPSQDAEMDMSDCVAVEHASHLQVMQAQGSDARTSRMPTPIQPSFAAQVRGQHCEWNGGQTMNGHTNMGHHHHGLDYDDNISPTAIVAPEPDWHSVQNNRRLPSPISETDDCAIEESDMMIDDHNQSPLPPHHEHSLTPPRTMEHPNAMDLECTHTPPSAQDTDGEPSSPSPSRKGHMRSKHTVNTWTWQPGMKRSFAIGYRSDCEKCRLKVPGHFNHIIVS